MNETDLYGYIDKTGKYVIEPQFSSAGIFSTNGLAFAQVEENGLYGYIDATGEFVIPAKYLDAYEFNEHGYACVIR